MTIIIWRFFKVFLHFFTYFQDLNRGGKGVTTKLLAGLKEFLERSPGRLVGGLERGAPGVAGSGEWVAAKVVVGHPEALEGVPRGHLERSILGRDLVLVKGDVVSDNGIGRRHDD
jgi:hypothetical protein